MRSSKAQLPPQGLEHPYPISLPSYFCFSPWHSLASAPCHWGTGKGSWKKSQLPRRGKPAKIFSF